LVPATVTYVSIRTCLPTPKRYHLPFYDNFETKTKTCAVAMKPCNAAAILFGLKFADTFTTSLREANLRKPDFRAPNVPAQNRI